MANILSRLVNRSQVSLLEDLTMAYVLCGIVMYASWFHCPQGLREPFAIRRKGASAANVRQPNALLNMPRGMDFGLCVVMLSLFVAIHLGAWHYPIPTAVEMWLWRVCVIMTFVLGMASAWFNMYGTKSLIPFGLLVTSYVLVRVTVIGVAFSVLRID